MAQHVEWVRMGLSLGPLLTESPIDKGAQGRVHRTTDCVRVAPQKAQVLACQCRPAETLYLDECTKLTCLPQSIGQLMVLQEFRMIGCLRLAELPDSIGQLKGPSAK